MLCIYSPTTDPYFNLAAEEYLFKNIGDDVFFLYINASSVVVGKHQNAMSEINPLFVFENDIKVVRRMSGGGAVYHDSGNLNFSFHKTVEDTSKVSFKSFNIPIVNLLRQVGVPAEISNRNDIVVNGYKVSGHAQHVFRKRVMSHGTLLIESDLKMLSGALRKGTGIYESKAIQSVRSRVANISDFFLNHFSAEEFMNKLKQFIFQAFQGAEEYQLSVSDLDSIGKLNENKYSTWDWNFGYSPVYCFRNEILLPSGVSLSCELTVEKGIISGVKVDSTAITESEKKSIIKLLNHQPHQLATIKQIIESEILLPLPASQLIKLIF